MQFDISAIAPDFSEFRVAASAYENLSIGSGRSPALDSFVAAVETEARERWRETELSAIPGIAAWRKAYRQFGIKKTSYRSSVERLVKNTLAGAPLPRINAFVDAYNAVSLKHVLPAGADDLDHVRGDLGFRYARDGDDFRDMSALGEDGAPLADPPKAGEVVYADAEKILCRRWNWRQDARSVIRPTTRRAVVTLQANGVGDPAAAAAELSTLVQQECGGRSSITLIDTANPMVELVFP